METVFILVGFALAAYAIVANDALQTLGTFLASNQRRPWWVLWLFAGTILSATLVYGWAFEAGVAYGRLDKIAMPEPFTWIYVIPPLVLLALTRTGVPVSTTFLILTIFSPKNLESMLVKSMLGYIVAFGAAIVLYLVTAELVEKRFLDTADQEPPFHWTVIQWCSTGFLWSQWLIQDLANIYVYLPRELDVVELVLSLALMLTMLAYTFYTAGGEIQKIVTSKTNTVDIRAATIIDLIYAIVLYIFKELSAIPMSTTWVFLGLLAGRELALTLRLQPRPLRESGYMVASDAGKALAGLAVSVALAVGLPVVAEAIDPSVPSEDKPPPEAPTVAAGPADTPTEHAPASP